CHGIRGPVDVDATVTAQTQVIADILRADVGYAAVAADVELGAGKVERASDAGGAAGSLDVAGHVRGPVLEEGQSLIDAAGRPAQDHTSLTADANPPRVTVARSVVDHHAVAQ